ARVVAQEDLQVERFVEARGARCVRGVDEDLARGRGGEGHAVDDDALGARDGGLAQGVLDVLVPVGEQDDALLDAL
ncbi:MAG TPA: hypothetical protein VIY27_05385, partial [Myxococcota bacterium]